jgi:hypothetical protein
MGNGKLGTRGSRFFNSLLFYDSRFPAGRRQFAEISAHLQDEITVAVRLGPPPVR